MNERKNPRVSFDKHDNKWWIGFDHPRKADFVWLGDCLYSNFGGGVGMVKIRHPKLYDSQEEAEKAVREDVLPYMREWKSGWLEYVKGWE